MSEFREVTGRERVVAIGLWFIHQLDYGYDNSIAQVRSQRIRLAISWKERHLLQFPGFKVAEWTPWNKQCFLKERNLLTTVSMKVTRHKDETMNIKLSPQKTEINIKFWILVLSVAEYGRVPKICWKNSNTLLFSEKPCSHHLTQAGIFNQQNSFRHNFLQYLLLKWHRLTLSNYYPWQALF